METHAIQQDTIYALFPFKCEKYILDCECTDTDTGTYTKCIHSVYNQNA